MKIRVLVVFGGMASEHSVSCKSAYNVLKYINRDKYDVSVMGISKDGRFFNYFGDLEKLNDGTWEEEKNKEFVLSINIELLKYDVIFPVLHGKYGEDGTIQGLFEMLKVNYVGCDVLGSSIAMDKIVSKKLVSMENINIVPYTFITKYDYITNEFLENLLNKSNLSFPLFVKPNREGSSYGTSKVNNLSELYKAVINALSFDDKVLIESYIDDRKEIECAVLGNSELLVTTPGEIISENEVYDFDSKYNSKVSYTRIPAEVDENILNNIKDYAKVIFKVLNLSGLSRIDFFVSNDKIYFNEVNTMPGFTDISMYPQMIMHEGISYQELLDRLIECAINR